MKNTFEDDITKFPEIGFKTFFGIFLRIIYVLRKIVATLFVFIIAMGFVLSFVEKLGIWNALYFAFVSSFTLGYGDIVPHTAIGRFICVIVLPITGMLLTGIMVAAAINAIDRGLRMGMKKS